jgi:assimilatory nitrate reductase catalytic subunit
MGGREVGGLANQLAAHMVIENPAHRDLVRQFWRAPRLAQKPGLKAVDLFEAVGSGRVKAVWIMATNPMISLPEAEQARTALGACPLVVVSDCVRRTDTAAFAHVLLPAAAWGEKDGTVTNSERRISRQRAFMPAPGEAKPDWWIISQVGRRMGYSEAFDYSGPAAIFREHAKLSGHGNDGSRDFDISGLAAIDDAGYDALAPVQWPVNTKAPKGTPRIFGDGTFFTEDRRARFVPLTPTPPVNRPDTDYPLVLNTGRTRDHWHTMTRTGKSARLSAHAVEPAIDMHPADAAANAIEDGDLAQLESRWGRMVARAHLTDAQTAGSVFAPIHWTDQFAPLGRVGAVVNPVFDPISGQPECKHTPVRIQRYAAMWHAFVLARQPLDLTGTPWWARARGDGYWRHEIAGHEPPADWDLWARLLTGELDGQAEWIAYRDRSAKQYRFAALRDRRLVACLFVAPRPQLPPRAWLGSLFRRNVLSAADRSALLAGRPPQSEDDAGPMICSCFAVGRNRIVAAIRERHLDSVNAIGKALAAGTNCGSCRPELATILAEERQQAAAAE